MKNAAHLGLKAEGGVTKGNEEEKKHVSSRKNRSRQVRLYMKGYF